MQPYSSNNGVHHYGLGLGLGGAMAGMTAPQDRANQHPWGEIRDSGARTPPASFADHQGMSSLQNNNYGNPMQSSNRYSPVNMNPGYG